MDRLHKISMQINFKTFSNAYQFSGDLDFIKSLLEGIGFESVNLTILSRIIFLQSQMY